MYSMKKNIVIGGLIAGLLMCGSGYAAVGDHTRYTPPAQPSYGSAPNTFQVTRQTAGYQVTFHVIPLEDGMRRDTGHSLMVKLERNGQIIRDAKVNSRVVFPDKSEGQQLMQRVGDWYTASYTMQGEVRHQLMILFQTADGKIHRSGTYYPK